MDSLGGCGGAVAVDCDLDGIPQGGESWPTPEQFLGLSNEELGKVDPVVMNLAVAKGIPSLAELDIGRYVRLADQWAAEVRRYLPDCEANFYRSPERWQNDLDFSHLAVLGWYVGQVLRIDYREEQKNLKQVLYTDPTDLFLNGVMDTRRGTCGNMALLWVVLGQRLGWPLSLACVGPHFICRYDDGQKVFNIEATRPGGDWISPPDRYYLNECEDKIPQRAVDCGSDLRALSRREMLGVFLLPAPGILRTAFAFASASRTTSSRGICSRAAGSCTWSRTRSASRTAWSCSSRTKRAIPSSCRAGRRTSSALPLDATIPRETH